MISFQIHKNEIKNAVVLSDEGKIGEEVMRRWIDVPELIVMHLNSNDLTVLLNKLEQIKAIKILDETRIDSY